MSENHRTFKIVSPNMRGSDVKNWQRDIKTQFDRMGIPCPIVVDGVYGVATRSYTASLCTALGMYASQVMENGVTPELRIRIRNRDRLTENERKRMADRVEYRRRLRARYLAAMEPDVSRPTRKILEDSWGYHPGVHDGIDVITPPNALLFAMVRSKVIDVRTGKWWGKAPSGDVTKGDGIIQLEILETVGPFKKGYHIGYGHAEKPLVKVGQIVEAGTPIGHAGLAVAWHTHLMYNNGSTNRGVGNLNPREILDYAISHG